jgi:hypothetical protein
MKSLIFATCAMILWTGRIQAQDVAPPVPQRAPETSPDLARRPVDKPAINETIALTVPKGTPVQVALDKEVRLRKVGQPIHARVVEPVYAFDKLVIPVGTEATGQLTKIERVSGGKRTVAALDADFTPSHAIEVEFSEFVLLDGKHIPVHTTVTPGSGQPIQFVSSAGDASEKNGVKDLAAEKAAAAKQAAKQEWANAMKQVKEPGKLHRIERYAIADLPIHPQYIDAGSVYFAELQDALDFGTEPMSPELAGSIGAMPAEGSMVEARLMTPLSSATAHMGDPVEAIISRPLFEGGRLILPQGSVLQGSVIQVHPAHHPGRNGELRLVFHQLRLADGVQQKVEASLAGVEAARVDHVKLDTEGGAHAAASNARFLTTTVAVGLGAFSMIGDSGGGDIGHSSAGGAGGYKLIGLAMGLAIRSQPLGMAMGAFGASRSIYANFVARGHDVVFPKNTTMEIGIASAHAGAAPAGSTPATTQQSPTQQ